MDDDNLISFEAEQVTRFDEAQALERFGGLYRSMKEASELTCTEGLQVRFNLLFLFADILEALNILTFNNLSRVIGIKQAREIWHDVKAVRK